MSNNVGRSISFVSIDVTDMSDHQAIQGEWVSIAPGPSGYRFPIGPELIGSKLRYQLDEDASPKQIDVEHRDPGARTRTAVTGIYELAGDSLKIQWTNGGDRPSQFPPDAAGDSRVLFLKRVR